MNVYLAVAKSLKCCTHTFTSDPHLHLPQLSAIIHHKLQTATLLFFPHLFVSLWCQKIDTKCPSGLTHNEKNKKKHTSSTFTLVLVLVLKEIGPSFTATPILRVSNFHGYICQGSHPTPYTSPNFYPSSNSFIPKSLPLSLPSVQTLFT